jgi:predicted transcriptional regulator
LDAADDGREGLEPCELDDEERAEIEAALEEAERGEFATEEEVAAVSDHYRRTSSSPHGR